MFGTSPEPVPRSLAEPQAGRERGPAEGPRREPLGITGLPAPQTPFPAPAAQSQRVQVYVALNGGHRNHLALFFCPKAKVQLLQTRPMGRRNDCPLLPARFAG